MPFPTHRPRRLRRTQALSNLVRETRLSPDAMIYPIFVGTGKNVKKEISTMPGQYTMSIDKAVETARETEKLGVGGLLLFGFPAKRTRWAAMPTPKAASSRKRLRAIRQNVSAAAGHGHLPVRIHVAWSLRRHQAS